MEYRNELKFVCDLSKLKLIEKAVGLVCFPDPHAGSDGRYIIRSMYFDSPDNMYYFHTKNGLDHRNKYRIRIYNGSDGYISLECKESLHGKKHKDIQQISKNFYENILDGVYDYSGKGLLERFSIDCNRFLLKPVTIIEYNRVPYVYPIGNVRITIDTAIIASSMNDLFSDQLCGVNVLPGSYGVLEVKYDDVLPGAITHVLSGYDLQVSSFSKYVKARDALWGNVGVV